MSTGKINSYPKTKNFWINYIENKKRLAHFKFRDPFLISDWEQKIKQTNTFKELDELGKELRREMFHYNTFNPSLENLKPEEKKELSDFFLQDLADLEKELVEEQEKVKRLIKENKQLTQQISNEQNQTKKLGKKHAWFRKKLGKQINNLHRLEQSKENIMKKNLNQNKNLENISNLLVNTIATAQQHLGVQDLTQITTSHKMPEGKSLRDLIDFYNNAPPQQGSSQPLTITEPQEIVKEIKVEVEKPVIKEVDKIIEVESEEQKKKIMRLEKLRN